MVSKSFIRQIDKANALNNRCLVSVEILMNIASLERKILQPRRAPNRQKYDTPTLMIAMTNDDFPIIYCQKYLLEGTHNKDYTE